MFITCFTSYCLVTASGIYGIYVYVYVYVLFFPRTYRASLSKFFYQLIYNWIVLKRVLNLH